MLYNTDGNYLRVGHHYCLCFSDTATETHRGDAFPRWQATGLGSEPSLFCIRSNISFVPKCQFSKLQSICRLGLFWAPDLFSRIQMPLCYKWCVSNPCLKGCIIACIPCLIKHINSTFIGCFINSTTIDEHLLCTKPPKLANVSVPSFPTVAGQTCLSLSIRVCKVFRFWFIAAAFSLPVFFGHIEPQLSIIEHLKDIFHVDFMGLPWALLRLIKPNPMQQLF